MVFIVKILGGLGNQMFQYAFGKALSLEKNIDVVFDLSYYTSYLERKSERDTGYSRPFDLQHLNVNLKPEANISPYKKYKRMCLNYLLSRASDSCKEIIHKQFSTSFFSEYYFPNKASYHPEVNQISLKKDVYFFGYWQSEKYFKKYRSEVLNDFQIIEPQSEINKVWNKKISECNSVSLHIRRTDYIKIGWWLGLDYYQKAIDYISRNVENPVFFIFSDDIEWVKENLKIPFEVHYMDHNSPAEAYEDLRLMSQCKYNIIANSSFSWWGAWLNNNKNKIVLAPKIWIPCLPLDEQPEIQADGWILIE